MPYTTLGYRPFTGTPDTTGFNPNNWTAQLPLSDISSVSAGFELYHLYLTCPALPGVATTATVMLNQGLWDVTLIGQANSWDPSQPMLCAPGDTLYVLFNVPTTTTPAPTVTAWFRYDSGAINV